MAKIKFDAEVKEVNAKKTASLDVTYKVVLHTADPGVLILGALDGEIMVNVTVEAGNGASD